MELFYAHYPDLEKSFLQYVSSERKQALEPWLVVCSSRFLSKRLSTLLAQQQGAVANIHFVTSNTLLMKLDEEAGPGLPVFPQDHLRDFLIKEILAEPALNRYPVSRSFVQALKSSLRDLADCLVEPDVMAEHLLTSQDPVFTQDYERMEWLTSLYRRYLEREAHVSGFRPYQQLFERALKQIEKSTYLTHFNRVVWYGFYDMPGRLLEFVNQLKIHKRLVVFAPYAAVPAYQFAKKFFETNWLGNTQAKPLDTQSSFVLQPAMPYLFASQGSAPVEGLEIVPAGDLSGEVFFTAKKILQLVEEQGFQFSDIAVLCRETAPFQDEIRRTFSQNCIPLNASFSYPLVKFPLGVFCLNLLSLALNGFERETVLAVLGSPYFSAPDKSSWYRQAAQSLANRDLNQWRDLLPQVSNYDPALLAWLEHCRQILQQLEESRAWQEQVNRALTFLKGQIEPTILDAKEAALFESVCNCIRSLANFSAVRAYSQPGEFIRELISALNGLTFHEVENVQEGVTFTDVQRARGVSFKVVFLLGMNEKNFPLLQPEDPILRDRYRYILRDVLGYWINQQTERAEEERLLFFSAITSARDKLFVTYAHAGADGKEAVPSVYVAELARATQTDWKADSALKISGRMSERIGAVSVHLLTFKELSYCLILTPQEAAERYEQAGLWTDEKARALSFALGIRRLGSPSGQDGFIQSGNEIFEQINQTAGFSPSALQELAACPMKYFFHKGLHLEEPDEKLSRWEWSADKRGTAYHEIMEEFYKTLLKLGLTHQLFDTGIAEYVQRALSRRYTVQSAARFGIYPLVWELILTQLREQLIAFAQADIKKLGDFTPELFEKEFSHIQIPKIPFVLQGIIDRIDIDRVHKQFIVADYKSSKKGGKDLSKAFFTHLIFQPFLYILAAQQLPQLAGFSSAGSCLLAVRPNYSRRDLSPQEVEAMRPQAEKFLTQLAHLIKQGSFFLNPTDLCAYCPYALICRKDSFTCLMRARRSAPSRRLEEARYGVS